MLRLLVAALLVANLLFWAWHEPAVTTALGLSNPADTGRDPARLARQVRPEAVRLLQPAAGREAARAALPAAPLPGAAPSAPLDATPLETASAPAPASMPVAASADEPRLCLEAGPMATSAVADAVRELTRAGVPPGGWVDVRRELPGRWIIYMGRFAERDLLQRKREELERLDLTARELKSPAELAPGLALGEFGDQADAQARLDRLQARGVRTARVLQLPSAGAEHRLRVERAERAAAEKLAALAPRNGRPRWQPCGT
jgi:hypothetical protein